MQTLKMLQSALLFSLSLLPGVSQAADTLSIPVTVKATIVIPPCTLNEGRVLDVNFNDVQIRDVNQNLRPERRTVTKQITITCPAAITSPNDLKVTVAGAQAAAGNYVLTTTGTGKGAGIALYQGDSAVTTLPLNQAVPLSGLGSVSGDMTNGYSGRLAFTAVVTKAGTTDVTEGEFSAGATLLLKQQ
ncbi:fimbrial protein [Salmonella enterica]|nr:fimbrial protein [Salmonella enterica subsp. enterica serovar Orientalis]EBJ4008363.1 fimbrial protein [Salmonella enterica]EBQ9235395.1 fimbrial protein [Salmonella enterica subsp. enterica serovar Orientalis]EKA1666413.1 fimbrial protein [Salmonella enterica]